VRTTLAGRVIAAAVLCGPSAACKRETPSAADLRARAEALASAKRAAEAAALPSPMTSAFVLGRVRAQTARGMVIASMKFDYVRRDGTLDPTYGVFDADLVRPTVPPTAPPDDPSRPLGAPTPPPPPPPQDLPPCHEITWAKGRLADAPSSMCFSFGTSVAAVRCTPERLWARAIADGAPASALARISLTSHQAPMTWRFAIDDDPRDVHFARDYPDDCAIAVEGGPPAGAPTP
jgi:hypothetical protein